MIFVAILVVIGLVRRQPWRYWAMALAALIVQTCSEFLFNGREGPAAGYVTRLLRGDGDSPAYLLVLPVAALFGWGLPIIFVIQGYTKPGTETENVESRSRWLHGAGYTSAAFLLATAVGWGSTQRVPSAPAPAAEWTRVSVASERVSALFPWQVTRGNDGPPGTETLTASSGECYLSVGDSPYPRERVGRLATTTTVLDGARDGAVTGAGGTLVSEEPVSIHGLPGRDFVISATQEGATYLVRSRFVLAGLHTIAVVSVGCDDATVSRFVEGVEIPPPPSDELIIPPGAATP
jgi:hypothetical protein